MPVQPAPINAISPWGIASGAEYAGKLPEIMPLLRNAGITGLRYFPEWRWTP